MPFRESYDIFEIGAGNNGMSAASVRKIPKLLITAENNTDASGEIVRCSVCLQVSATTLSRDLPTGFFLRRLTADPSHPGPSTRGDCARLAAVPPHLPPPLHRPLVDLPWLLPRVPP